MFCSLRTALCLGSVLAIARGQDQKPANDNPTPPQVSSLVAVPTYPNPSCPIMGKPVSTKLFAETEKGRLYVCCKGCIKDILADVETAYRTAFSEEKKVANATCPVTGDPVGEDARKAAFQGFEFSIHSAACEAKARENLQIVLAKLNDPKLVDMENKTCPVTGAPTAKNAFVVIEGAIVRLSSPKLVEEIVKDPAKVLAKAKEIRAKERASPQAQAKQEQG